MLDRDPANLGVCCQAEAQGLRQLPQEHGHPVIDLHVGGRWRRPGGHLRSATADDLVAVDFDELVEMTDGLSGADLKAIVTETGMFVIRRKGKAVTMLDFKDAYNKMIIKDTKEEASGMFV